MSNQEHDIAAHLLALRSVSGLGDSRITDLVNTFGNPEAVIEASFDELDSFHYIDSETYETMIELDETVSDYQAQLARAQDEGIEIIPFSGDRYPEKVRRHNAPVVLFARGNTSLLTAESVSFAGSRDANDAAREWTRKVSATLVDAGYVVVSGGAFGIDTAAHEGALEAGGQTVVVQPGGLNNLYPGANKELFESIVESNGLLVSQQPPDHEPSRYDFLNRNKTNSALSLAVVIGAASDSGGTISQYQDAAKQGKDIFVPALDRDNEPKAGIEEMIQDDGVTPVSSGAEIINTFADDGGQTTFGDW